MKYLIVIERTATGCSAYSPDVPGCIVTGSTRMEAGIADHIWSIEEIVGLLSEA